jgi:iron(III) transport system ATP-binding protein
LAKLRFSDVTHRFGPLKAVDGLSLDLAEGEILCLLGPSGCGKTTSLRLAAGLEELQAGRIEIDGRVVAEPGRASPPEQRRVGMVFQDYALFPHLTVAGNVAFGLKHMTAGDRQERAMAMLARVGLTGRADVYPHQLSGGEQQRVALARALAPEPRLMLMDEPFANLDVTLRNSVRDETLSLLKGLGSTVLLVTHDPEEAMRMADRIAVMQAGRLVQVGPAEDVYLRPADPFMARFFGPVNEVPANVKDGVAATPLGSFPAAGAAEGRALAVIRPEAMVLGPDGGGGDGVEAAVTDIRLIGAYWRVALETEAGLQLRARTTVRPPGTGERIRVTVDPQRLILFPERAI